MALNLRLLKRELDFTESAGVVYGTYEGYIVSFSLKVKEIEVFVDAKVDPSDAFVVDRLRKFIQNNANGFRITASSLSSTGVSITVGDRDVEGILELFYLLINQLKLLKVSGDSVCANCGKAISGRRRLVKIGSHVHACDQNCSNRIMSSDKAAAAKTKVAKRGLPGFLGSFIFSILGAVPYFLLGYYALPNYYAAALIPLACAAGFFLFGGKKGLVKLLCCILLPIIFLVVASAAILAFTLYGSWFQAGYVINLAYIRDVMLQTLHPWTPLLMNLLRNQLLYAGIFLALGYLAILPGAYSRADPYFALLRDYTKE